MPSVLGLYTKWAYNNGVHADVVHGCMCCMLQVLACLLRTSEELNREQAKLEHRKMLMLHADAIR